MFPGWAGIPVITVGPVLVMPAPARIAKSAVVPRGGACAWLEEVEATTIRLNAAKACVKDRETHRVPMRARVLFPDRRSSAWAEPAAKARPAKPTRCGCE